MVETKQTPQEKDNELLKTVFKDNEYLLKLLRALFFGFEVSDKDRVLIKKTFEKQELRDAVRRKFYSKFGDEAMLGMIPDFWVQIPEEKLIGQSEQAIYQTVYSRVELLKMFEKAMALLENPDGEKLSLDFDPNLSLADGLQIKLIARNKFLNSIESGLKFIQITADAKEETDEEKKKKLLQNSSK